MSCFDPRVIARENWPQSLVVDFQEPVHCIMIAADSEASAVEIWPDGDSGLSSRIVVAVGAPYFGTIQGKVTIAPVAGYDSNVGQRRYHHRMKLLAYKTAPPFISTKRDQGRYSWGPGSYGGGSELDASMEFPIVPTFGRKRIFFVLGHEHGTGTIVYTFQGIRSHAFYGKERFLQPLPDGHIADGGDLDTFFDGFPTAYDLLSLSLSASTYNSYNYEGNFDYVRVVTDGGGDGHTADLHITVED